MSLLCGVNGSKETTKRLQLGGGVVKEVVTSPCKECGDLSTAFEWTPWRPCPLPKNAPGMFCRKSGNSYLGYENEGM